MDLSRRTWLALILAFLMVGVGLMLLVEREAENRAKSCAAQCKAEGKRALYLPPGTMGQTVEGGSTGGSDWRMAFENCHCVSSSTGAVSAPKQ
jgi:hypothetical protein